MFFFNSGNSKRRLELIKVFSDTKKTIMTTPELLKAVDTSAENLEILNVENKITKPPVLSSFDTQISVSKHRTMEAAFNLHKRYAEDRIAVLNFANAYTPGGGVTRGASAQEECLCRITTLYPVLKSKRVIEEYYKKNAREDCLLAPARLVYAEDIVVFKNDTDYPKLLDKKEWLTCDVITAAAPDLRGTLNKGSANLSYSSEEALFDFHVTMALNILKAAYRHKVRILVLGAFGCGVFLNPPAIVANAYRHVIKEFNGVFSHIEFAVYCGSDTKNYEVFKEKF